MSNANMENLAPLSLSVARQPAALTPEEAEELLLRVAEYSRVGVSLTDMLRQAASSTASPQLARAYVVVAEQLQAGRPLEEALAYSRRALPVHLAALLGAAFRSGECQSVLFGIFSLRETLRAQWKNVWSALSYPLTMLVLMTVTFLFILNSLVGPFRAFLQEFKLSLPVVTQNLFWLHDQGQWYLLASVLSFCAMLGIVRLCFPVAVWYRLLMALPLVGPLLQNSGLAEFTQLLGLLVEASLPLPDAVELAGAAASNQDIAVAAKRVAGHLRSGVPMPQAFAKEDHTFPSAWQPFLAAGIQSAQLPRMLASVSQMHLEAMDIRANLIRDLAPSVIFLMIGVIGYLVPIALFVPLFALITSLSYSAPNRALGLMISTEPAWNANFILFLTPLLTAVMVTRRLFFRTARDLRWNQMGLVFEMLEWRLLLVLLIGAVLAYSVVAIPLVVLFLFMVGRGLILYANMHKRSLLQRLAACGEAGLPLPWGLYWAASAMPWGLQSRVDRLAHFVNQGVSVSESIRKAWLRLPYELRFPLCIANVTGDYGRSLQESLRMEADARRDDALFASKLNYLWWIVGFMFCLISYMQQIILPHFDRVIRDFGLPLPAITEQLYLIMYWFSSSPLVQFAFIFVFGLSLLVIDPLVSRIFATIFPPWEWLRRGEHGPVVLRGLAVIVAKERPLGEALDVVAREYSIYVVARLLRRVRSQFELGIPWTTALGNVGLIGRYDAAILAAAERANNLAWALEEVARHAHRRRRLRLRWLANILFPLLLIVLSLLVTYIAVSLFLPLVVVIQGMSGP